MTKNQNLFWTGVFAFFVAVVVLKYLHSKGLLRGVFTQLESIGISDMATATLTALFG